MEQASAAAVPVPSNRVWPQLLPELSERIASFLSCNERACTLRLINKAAAAQFSGPQHTTVRLSQPVPPHAFTRHWAAPGATHDLSYRSRLQLLCLTAASGSIPNVEVALEAAGCLPTGKVLAAAAAAGQLAMCEFLLQRGCPCDGALEAAAEAGQREACEWLLARGCDEGSPPRGRAVCMAAARGGHVGLMEWLMRSYPERFPPPALVSDKLRLLTAVANGCDLPTLQRVHWDWHQAPRDQQPPGVERQVEVDPAAADAPMARYYEAGLIGEAVSSGTADWREKVEWLEAQGYPRVLRACQSAASFPDDMGAASRLAWLWERGYPVGPLVASYAAGAGNLSALQLYMSRERVDTFPELTRFSASQGHLRVVSWLVEVHGLEQAKLELPTFSKAATFGSLELMVWLRERGCPWGAGVFAAAVEGGNAAALEWLAGQRCPKGDDGWPYVRAASNQDTATLRCLAGLGCPWGPHRQLIQQVMLPVKTTPGLLSILRLLLDAGCTMDWEGAEAMARRVGRLPLEAFLVEERARRQQRHEPAAL